MRYIREFMAKIAALFSRNRFERELDEEIRFHLDMEADEQLRKGVSRRDAEAAARRQFGGMDQMKEEYRARRSVRSIEVVLQDLKYAVRVIRKTPLVYGLLVLVFALGIGVNTAVISIVDCVLFRALPFPRSEELVRIWHLDSKTGQRFMEASATEVTALRERLRPLARIAAFSVAPRILNDGAGEPIHATIGRVSDDLTAVLEESPAAGRTFTSDEFRQGEAVVVLTHRLWQNRYGGNREVVGQSVRIDNESFRIVGVAGPHAFPAEVDLWRPLRAAEQEDDDREYQIIARLAPGATLEQLGGALDSGFWAQSMQTMLVRNVKTPLLLQLGAVGLVLAIACANVANLLLAQGWRRSKEIGIRAALGASRLRIVGQLLIEAMVLSAVGGVLGVVIGRWCVQMVRIFNAGTIPRLEEAAVDSRVLAIMAIVVAASGIAAALAPALQLARSASGPIVRTSDRTHGMTRHAFRQSLVVLQITLSTFLLITAGLVLKSFGRLMTFDRGYQSHNVLAVPITLRSNAGDFYDRVLQRVTMLPNVERAALAMKTPVDALGLRVTFSTSAPGALTIDPGSKVLISPITPDYFATTGIAIRSGRAFEVRDRKGAQPVAIVNETFSRKVFGTIDAVGKPIRTQLNDTDVTIVGVAADATPSTNAPQSAAIYFPFSQFSMRDMTLLVRTSGELASVARELRAAIWEINPTVPLDKMQTLDDQLAESAALPRFQTFLLGSFALLAITLCSLGVYGIMADWVGEREHEIGIRRALGASEVKVVRMVFKSGLQLTACGVLLGILGALWADRLVASMLFEVSPTDPLTFAGVVLLVTAVAMIAAALPAVRAVKLDPSRTLRSV